MKSPYLHNTSQASIFANATQLMPWIVTRPGHPYFFTEEGKAWTPIGQNDAITWPDLQGLFMRKNVAAAEAYFKMLVQKGVTCLRLMLEYCHTDHRYFEKADGTPAPHMVHLWDDMFGLCEKFGLRILLTPYDTFWMWRRWQHHPYNAKNGGPIRRRTTWLTDAAMRAAIKRRLHFATARWGSSGALFGWDLWNELEPRQAGGDARVFTEFIDDIGGYLRDTELAFHGRAHLQTVSVYAPLLLQHAGVAQDVFRHPKLHFATLHFYHRATIDAPKAVASAAATTGRLVREALQEIGDGRPFFDSEHGPIYTFNIKRKTLPEAFDDVLFRAMQWAHLASGGAGGGLRWPYRHPHCLTPGMRHAQHALAQFVPLINWASFQPKNYNEEVQLSQKNIQAFACGDAQQAIVYLLRKQFKPLTSTSKPVQVQLPGLSAGAYCIHFWDAEHGVLKKLESHTHKGDAMKITAPSFEADLIIAITPQSA